MRTERQIMVKVKYLRHLEKCRDDLIRKLKIVVARIEIERQIKGDSSTFLLNAEYESIKELLKKASE